MKQVGDGFADVRAIKIALCFGHAGKVQYALASSSTVVSMMMTQSMDLP